MQISIHRDQNANQYTQSEAAEILAQTERYSLKRRSTMEKMIQLGYTPCVVRTLQRIMKKKDLGDLIVNKEWGNSNGGRKRKLTNGELDDLVQSIPL